MLVIVNVDDIASESVPYIIEKVMELGAQSVHAIPVIAKKGRPGFIFLIDTVRDNVRPIGDFLVKEVGTLGLRLFEEDEHIKFDYEVKRVRLVLRDADTSLSLGVKVIRDMMGSIASVKAEHKDLRAAVDALSKAGVGISLVALKGMVEAAVLEGEGMAGRELNIELVK